MSDTTWRCGRCGIGGLGLPVGHLCMDDWLLPSPASDHQRALSERDEARAQAAVMRRALEFEVGFLAQYGYEPCPESQAALSSSAGRALLEEMEGLKESERAANEMAADRLTDAHGDGQESAMNDALEALGLERGGDHFAKLADLRARLERAESAAQSSHQAVEELRRDRTRLEAAVQRQQRATAAEVRRAVEEAVAKERAECERDADGAVTRDRPAAGLNDWQKGYSTGRQDAASAIRARGKG